MENVAHVAAAGFLSHYMSGPIGGIAPNQVIARSEFEVHRKILRSECNEGCDWCIYVRVVTCADTLTSTLCIQ